jgi:peptidyl-prolyl cis-trans isomerase D
MIGAMRRNLKALSITLWVVIAAFIGTTFLVWGKGSIRGGDANTVATVNGEEIAFDRYQRLYRSYVEFYRQLYRERFTPELAERLGLSQQVLNDLILETLILQRAKAEGIQVGDPEVRATIQTIRAFHEGGRFSQERYLRILSQARITPADFEEEQRREILKRKVEATIKSGVKVSELEIRQAYDFRRERVKAVWVQVEIQPLLAKISATDGEIEAYLKEHPSEFQRPERRRLQYVLVTPKNFQVPAVESEVAAYYREHAAEFETPRRVKVSHILVRVPPTGGSQAENHAKAKVESAIKRVRAGEEFAKVAKEVSEDPASAAAGGELGFVAQGELVPQFEQAAFALKKGEITPEPVRTPVGYHAIRVSDIQEAGRRALKEVADQIREKLQRERSDKRAQAKTEEARAAIQSAGDFSAAAKALGLDPKEAVLARGEPLAEVGPAPEVDEVVFNLAVGGTSASLKTPSGYVVLKILDRLPAAVPPLLEIRGEVAQAVKRRKAETQALERANALAGATEQGEDLFALAKREGLLSGDTGFFSRAEPPPDKRLPSEVMRAALELAVGRVSQPVKSPQGVFVVKVIERQPADPAGLELEKERDELARQLLERKRTQAWEAWVSSLRATAKIDLTNQVASPQ